jgi:hypothetical protein
MFGCCRFITPSDSHHAHSLCHASYAFWCYRRSGDLHPIGCKAESCGVAASMFVFVCGGYANATTPSKERPRDTASSDLVDHETTGISIRRLPARLPDPLEWFTRKGNRY